MRLQSSHSNDDRGLDAYFSPPEAVYSLLDIEEWFIPYTIWEPAAGDGAIVKPFREAEHEVIASDLVDYGLKDCASGVDYLKSTCRIGVEGIVTNPPFKLALQFAEKAISEVPYVALLLRTNFLESMARMKFFKAHPPTRIWVSSRRLPMMHRQGWTGPRAPSNTCFAWFVWNGEPRHRSEVDWFDWKEIMSRRGKQDCAVEVIDELSSA